MTTDLQHVSRVSRAADALGATDLGDGIRWAYYAAETGRYWVVDEDDMARLCDYLDDADEQIRRDAYSLWCADTSADPMPRGWTPGTLAA